jgi:putative ABC transport system substrate-binding protein
VLAVIFVAMFVGGDASAGQRQPVDIAMVLFRGMTRAEEGFLDTLKKSPDFDVNVTIFDTAQNPAKLQEVIGRLEKGSYRLIYVFGTTATQQIMKRIKNTPIVFNIVQRPIEAGIIKEWNSSGNNITGASNYVSMESAFKTIGMLMHIHKLGFMYYANDPSTAYQKADILQQQRRFGFSLVDLPIKSKETISNTMKQMLDEKPEAVMVPSDSFIKANGDKIFATLNKHRIPSIVIIPEMVKENGALLALGPDYYTLGQLAAENSIEILKGKKPSELPIERVSQLSLVINQRTADKLGITIPMQLRRLSEIVR